MLIDEEQEISTSALLLLAFLLRSKCKLLIYSRLFFCTRPYLRILTGGRSRSFPVRVLLVVILEERNSCQRLIARFQLRGNPVLEACDTHILIKIILVKVILIPVEVLHIIIKLQSLSSEVIHSPRDDLEYMTSQNS